MDARLIGTFTCKSPLSHIGESIGTTSYLVQEPILQDDGEVEEVFAYSGNAWRGQLRDLMAEYLLHALGLPKLSVSAFELLFSGGKIGGEQVVDLAVVRATRDLLPHFALMGGGLGNQIVAGSLRVGNCYPICVEAQPVLLESYSTRVSYRQLTTEKEFSRMDNSKDVRYAEYLALPEPVIEQAGLLPDPEPKKGKKPAKKEVEVSTQMRMGSELLIGGTRLETWIDVVGVSEITLGALVSGLHRFARFPHIGGQAGKGHGRVDLAYDIVNLETGERQPFVSIAGGLPSLSPLAEEAKYQYDQHVKDLYDQMLADKGAEIVGLLKAA